MSVPSAQMAHDELLAQKPLHVRHEPCALCHSGAGTAEKAKEVAEVAGDDRTFTESQHQALLTDAVARETASLNVVKEELEARVETLSSEKAAVDAEKAELQSRIDVLEAERAAAQKAHEDSVAEFEAFKTDLEEKAAVEARKADRVTRVKAANASLGDAYFTEERVLRWAQMSDEQFDSLVADITESAATSASSTETKPATEQARETAAFTGGTTPTVTEGSTLGALFARTGKLPAPANH
jgi:chromosome segregation ATPase